jgi:hypothetical protein
MTSDMRAVIIPKSDQQNSDDFLAGPRTIKISRVEIRPDTEQPVSIFFDGDNGKPYKPCKSMRRVLVGAWGPDANVYLGRSITLYRDPTAKFGGIEVGGIRISHMSHIEGKTMLSLTVTRGQRKPYTVLPLVVDQKKAATATTTKAADKAPATTENGARDYLVKLSDGSEVPFETPRQVADFMLRGIGKVGTLAALDAFMERNDATIAAVREDDAEQAHRITEAADNRRGALEGV